MIISDSGLCSSPLYCPVHLMIKIHLILVLLLCFILILLELLLSFADTAWPLNSGVTDRYSTDACWPSVELPVMGKTTTACQ